MKDIFKQFKDPRGAEEHLAELIEFSRQVHAIVTHLMVEPGISQELYDWAGELKSVLPYYEKIK